jgi:hypothetical protein
MLSDQNPTDEFAVADFQKDFFYLKRLYELFASSLVTDYAPYSADPLTDQKSFSTRIEDWIEAFDCTADRWTAFKALQYVMYLGDREFLELYRLASTNCIDRWLIELNAIDIFASNAEARLRKARSSTWICPLTDSMNINGFLNRTGFPKKEAHPQLHSLSGTAFRSEIIEKIDEKKFKHFILIEDFVGSGTQICKVLDNLGSALHIPVLVLPLVVCEEGLRLLREKQSTHPNLTIDFALLVADNCLLKATPKINMQAPETFSELAKLIEKIGIWDNPFGHLHTGALGVKHQNCPNNVPPIFHQKHQKFKNPIFPRHNKK